MTFGCPNRLYLTHREGRRTGWNVFALEDGDVYYTYSRTAPDRFLLAQSYSQHSTMSPTDATRTSRCDAMRSTRGIGASTHRHARGTRDGRARSPRSSLPRRRFPDSSYGCD